MNKYPPDVLTPENLASTIDEVGEDLHNLTQTVLNDEDVGVFGLDVRLTKLEQSTVVTTWVRELTFRVDGLDKNSGMLREDMLFLQSQINDLEIKLKTLVEIHLGSIEEHTAQMDMVIKLLTKPTLWQRIKAHWFD